MLSAERKHDDMTVKNTVSNGSRATGRRCQKHQPNRVSEGSHISSYLLPVTIKIQ